MPDESGINIPVTSTWDGRGTDAAAAAGAKLGADLKRLQEEEAKANAPVAPPVSAPGAPATQKALQDVGTAGAEAGDKVAGGMSEAAKFVHQLQEGAAGLAGSFKAGIGIGAAEAVLSTLESVREKLAETVREGVEVNKEFETLGVSLTSSLRQADPGKFGDFNTALKESGTLIDTIKAKALELNLDAGELGHNLQINMLALVEGGIKNVNQQVETTGLLMQAAAAKGVTGFQAVKDVVDILQGRAERVILSRELGITNEDIARAKQAGDLAGYLATKLGAYREAAAATRDTLAGLEQQEASLGKNLLGTLTAPLFETVKETARETVDILKDPGTAVAVGAVAEAVGAIARPLPGILKFTTDIGAAFVGIAGLPFVFTSNLNAATAASAKLGQGFAEQVRTLQDQVQLADTFEKKQAALAAVTDALAAAEAKAASERKAGNTANAEILEAQARILQSMLDKFGTIAGTVVKLHETEEGRKATMQEQQKLLDDQLTTIAKIDKTIEERSKVDLKTQSPEEIRSQLGAQLQNARDLLNQGGLGLNVDYNLTDPKDILRLRDQLREPAPLPSNATAEQKKAFDDASAAQQALKFKISETALSVSDLERAFATAFQRSAKETGQAVAEIGRATAQSQQETAKATEAAKKDGDKMIADRRAFMAALGQEKGERDELTRAQKELAAAQAASDAASEAGQQRIKEAVQAVTQAQKDLKAAEDDRQKAQEKSFPAETARLREIERLLREMPVTGTEATAAAREKLVNERTGIKAQLDNNNVPIVRKSLDDLDRESLQNAANGDARDRANLPPPRPPAPPALPPDFDRGPGFDDGGLGAKGSPAGNVNEATAKAADAAGKVNDAAGKLAPALDGVRGGIDALTKAQQAGTAAIVAAVSGALIDTTANQAVLVGQIAAIKADLAQVKFRLNSVANS